jgi:hypothetical protein
VVERSRIGGGGRCVLCNCVPSQKIGTSKENMKIINMKGDPDTRKRENNMICLCSNEPARQIQNNNKQTHTHKSV